jgi:imidazolonepropionase-like amidohydrolase
MARYIRNLRDALVKEGFTPEEALRIATTLPVPSVGMQSR